MEADISFLEKHNLLPAYKLRSDSWFEKLPKSLQQLKNIIDIHPETHNNFIPRELRDEYGEKRYIPVHSRRNWHYHMTIVNDLNTYQKSLIFKLLRGEQNVLR